MGTPQSELEFKYFTEGNAHARSGKRRNFRFLNSFFARRMQQTQLEALRKTVRDTQAQRVKANDHLDRLIDVLQIEAAL